MIGEECRHGPFRDALDHSPQFALIPGDEIPHQERQVLTPLAQRWQRYRKDVEPVIEIFPKVAGGYMLDQIAVGCRNDTHIHAGGLHRSQALEFAVLQYAQELGLQVEGEFADLVQEDRAGIREFEASYLAGEGAREGALLMPEEFTLDERRGQGRTVDFDQRPVFARTAVVNGPRDEFLARTRFAQDQYRGIGDRHPLY